MDEHNDDEFDENGFDPTKDAFFSDLLGMEEDIASEAYELVEHAINLIESKYYEDAVEVLRQAIGLYTQINREDEIEAVTDKIAEVYLLKEQSFRESEINVEEESAEIEDVQISKTPRVEQEPTEIKDEVMPKTPTAEEIEPDPVLDEIEVEPFVKAGQYINEGQKLMESNQFEEALDKYDMVVAIYEGINNPEGLKKVFQLIEDCYNKKAEFLRSVKKEKRPFKTHIEPIKKVISVEEVPKDEKLQQYLDSKKREEEISARAYELLGNAAEFTKAKQYEQALELYREGADLFQQLNWPYEVEKVQDTILGLEKVKLAHLQALERGKIERKEEFDTQMQQVEKIDQQVQQQEDQEKVARFERLKEVELQKMELEFFKAQIDNMATEASHMARQYELDMQKSIKRGELIEECKYPQVIEIYKRIKELLIDKGWRNEAAIYDDTIDVYIQKFEKDKKLREVESKKLQKQKDIEEMHKAGTIDRKDEEKLKLLEKKKAEEDFETSLTDMIDKAERLVRDHETEMRKALRKGEIIENTPCSEVIEIYKNLREQVYARGWKSQAE
ncbi:MAG: hypothetical protein ACXAEX_11230, partial [Promethearchaeota archaeon]